MPAAQLKGRRPSKSPAQACLRARACAHGAGTGRFLALERAGPRDEQGEVQGDASRDALVTQGEHPSTGTTRRQRGGGRVRGHVWDMTHSNRMYTHIRNIYIHTWSRATFSRTPRCITGRHSTSSPAHAPAPPRPAARTRCPPTHTQHAQATQHAHPSTGTRYSGLPLLRPVAPGPPRHRSFNCDPSLRPPLPSLVSLTPSLPSSSHLPIVPSAPLSRHPSRRRPPPAPRPPSPHRPPPAQHLPRPPSRFPAFPNPCPPSNSFHPSAPSAARIGT